METNKLIATLGTLGIASWPTIGKLVGLESMTAYRRWKRFKPEQLVLTSAELEAGRTTLFNFLSTNVNTVEASITDPLICDCEVVEATEIVTHKKAAQRATDKLSVANKILKNSYRTDNAVEEIIESITHLLPKFTHVPLAPRTEPIQADSVGLIVHLTDLHAFEVVNSSNVLGLNNVTGNILCDRLQSVVESTVSRINGSVVPFSKVVVALGGDTVSGLIHGLDRYVEGCTDPISVAVNAAGLLARAVRDIADASHARGIPVEVTGVCGNHGRLRADTPSQNLNAPRESFDFMIHALVASLLRDSPIKQFYFPDSLHSLFAINGQTIMLTHGDCIAKGRSFAEALHITKTRFAAALGVRIDGALMGHVHHFQSYEDAFVTASLKGGCSYATNILQKASDAAQALYIVSNRGITQERIYATAVENPQYRMRWTDDFSPPPNHNERVYIMGLA